MNSNTSLPQVRHNRIFFESWLSEDEWAGSHSMRIGHISHVGVFNHFVAPNWLFTFAVIANVGGSVIIRCCWCMHAARVGSLDLRMA